MRTSGSSRMPVSFSTFSWAISISRRTSAAVAPPDVGDEVRVDPRDLGAADALALEPGRIDESARVVARRVLEDRAARRDVEGLRARALRQQAGRPRPARPRAWTRSPPGAPTPRSCPGRGRAGRDRRSRAPRAGRQRVAGSPGATTSISSTTSCTSREPIPAFIVIQPPTTPGMPAPNSRPARPRSTQKRVRLAWVTPASAKIRPCRVALEHPQARELHDHPRDAGVADETVEAGAEREVREVVGGAHGQQREQIFARRGLRQGVRGTADPQRGVARHRHVEGDVAGESVLERAARGGRESTRCSFGLAGGREGGQEPRAEARHVARTEGDHEVAGAKLGREASPARRRAPATKCTSRWPWARMRSARDPPSTPGILSSPAA